MWFTSKTKRRHGCKNCSIVAFAYTINKTLFIVLTKYSIDWETLHRLSYRQTRRLRACAHQAHALSHRSTWSLMTMMMHLKCRNEINKIFQNDRFTIVIVVGDNDHLLFAAAVHSCTLVTLTTHVINFILTTSILKIKTLMQCKRSVQSMSETVATKSIQSREQRHEISREERWPFGVRLRVRDVAHATPLTRRQTMPIYEP